MVVSEPVFIGVDIGGSKVAAGVVNAHGKISAKTRAPMLSQASAEEAFSQVRTVVDSIMPEGARRGPRFYIGVSCPGPLDPRKGVIINPPNLPCWRDFPLAQRISETWSHPAVIDNDANAAALAEAVWGAGAGFSSVFYATLGTGIGTGIVLDGAIYHGRTGAAGEGGHVSIDYNGPRCGCGKRGCIEVLASGPAVAARARRRLQESGEPSKILELAGGNLDAVSAHTVGEAYRQGDKLATTLLSETADYLAIWLGNVIDMIEPDVIIFGGGMGELMSGWFDSIHDQLPNWSINSRCKEIPLVRARYREDSGIAGGAAVCLHEEMNDR
jgi:glucokinase